MFEGGELESLSAASTAASRLGAGLAMVCTSLADACARASLRKELLDSDRPKPGFVKGFNVEEFRLSMVPIRDRVRRPDLDGDGEEGREEGADEGGVEVDAMSGRLRP